MNVMRAISMLQDVLDQFGDCADLSQQSLPELGITLLFFHGLVDVKLMELHVYSPLHHMDTPDGLDSLFQRGIYQSCQDPVKVTELILEGNCAVFHADGVHLVNVSGTKARPVSNSDTETVITGPHDSFTEDSDTNLSLVRSRLKSPKLRVVQFKVGEVTKTKVHLLYIEGIANEQLLSDLKNRVQDIEFDGVLDTNILIQMIDDNAYSLFPQFLTSERPDVAISKLLAGRIVGICDGSPFAFCAPTGFFDFFQSADDYSQRWLLGSATRSLRSLAVVISLMFTAFYVALTSYHYEMIPEDLISSIAKSRARVPFPPVLEALIMEVTIESLREAGARLPSKIGQTIGIVGGIVIGTAAVQAGFTSNILIIVVAISALASFVIPSYVLSGSIRLARFGLILMAGILGNYGIILGICILVIHLSSLTSLGTSYLVPLTPFSLKDWKDTFIRTGLKWMTTRPSQAKPRNRVRMRMKR